MSGDLERRYRRVLQLLPRYYRAQWERDMIGAFLDGWLTGDPELDEHINRVAWPGWAEVTCVAGLAARLYLGGSAAPRRYFARGQAVRRAVLAVLLVHAVLAVDILVFLERGRRLVGWLPPPPASLVIAVPGGVWGMAYYLVSVAWIAIFVTLALGHYRTARVLAALAIVPGLVALLQAQRTGIMPAPFGPWAFWVLVDLAPVLAMTAFHRDAPPGAPGPWLLALPAGYVLVYGPLLALQATGNSAWLPDVVAFPTADVAALTALIRQAYDSGDAVGMSVAGKLWQAPQPRRRFIALRAEQVNLLSRTQAFQLYRLLVPSG